MFNNRYIIILLLVPLLCSCVSQKNYLIKDINFIEYESLTIDASRLIVVQKYNVNDSEPYIDHLVKQDLVSLVNYWSIARLNAESINNTGNLQVTINAASIKALPVEENNKIEELFISNAASNIEMNLDVTIDLLDQNNERISYVNIKVFKSQELTGNISLLENIVPPFPRITYDEATKILKDNGSEFEYGNDFGAPDETILSSQFDKPIMIHRWPANIKPFYMKRDRDNIELALGVDMIAPEGYGEIVGGGQREDDLDILTKSIRHHDLPLEPFQWFLDLRKYGSVPHSGFGLGLERVVAWICGTKHIRETIPFPRTMARLEP